MNIIILSRNRHLYSTQRLMEASKFRGHGVRVIDPLGCYMNITTTDPAIYYREELLNNRVDAVIPRIGASITFYGTAVVRQFESIGAFCVNESVPIARARDKLRALQMLSKKGLGLPNTGFAHSPKKTTHLIRMVGGTPLVVKLLEGTQGKGVILAENSQAATGVIDTIRGLDAYFLVQEFIEESKGADIRCFVIGNKVVAAMKRQAKEGEFRSNLHRGGHAEAVEISEDERKTAVAAARILGLRVAGVDLLRSKRGPLIMEVNSSPGLQGIETATQVDVAGAIVEFIEREVHNKSASPVG